MVNPASTADDSEESIGLDDIDDIDDIPDPEPLPDSLTAEVSDDLDDQPIRRRSRPIAKPKKKSNKGIYIMIALLILILALVGGLYFLRSMVVQYVPAMGGIYEMIGLTAEAEVGSGLVIERDEPQYTSANSVDYLIITGSISNTTEATVEIPLLKAILSNADGDPIQNVVQEPPQPSIEKMDAIGYKIEIEEPSPLARYVKVVFIPRPNGDAEHGSEEESH